MRIKSLAKRVIKAPFNFVKWVALVSSVPSYYRSQRIKLKQLRKQYGNKPIRVGFLGYLDGPSCDIFTDLYRQFKKDSNFTCEVVAVPYTHDEKDKMIHKFDVAVNYLKSLGIDALPGYDKAKDCFIDYSGRFDIVFFEIEYDWVDPLFKVNNFKDTVSFIIPYGQYLADNINAHLSFPMMSQVYNVFPTSVAVGKMMKKYSKIFGINICKEYLGNPKIDRFFDKSITPVDVWSKSKPTQKRIIWAPHHTWADYSNFPKYAEYMLQLAEDHKEDLFIAIKPHPALKDSLKGINGWSEDEIATYYNRWKNGTNTDLFEGAWFDLFKTSDAMLLDSIGFMLEYSLSGKPACVLYKLNKRGKRMMNFSDCGEQIYELLYHAKDEPEIEEFVNMILNSDDNKKLLRDKYIEDNYLPPYHKKGSENIYDYIVKLLS